MKMSKNLKIILYIASVLIVVCLVLLLGNHLPILAKGAIMTTGLASFVFGLYDDIGPLKINLSKEREKNVWDYCKIIIQCLYFSRPQSILLEFGFLTPGSLIKNIMLGIGLSVQLLLMFYFLFKRINEEPDERFYRNIAKSSSILFTIAIFILLGMATLIAVCKVFVLNAGFLYILVAFLLLLFAITYFITEKRG